MKSIFIIFALMFLTSCQQNCPSGSSSAGCETQTEPAPDTTPIPEPDHGPDVPSEAFLFDATITFVNFEAEQEAKVNKAIEIIKKVVASSEFKSRVLNFTYQGKKQFHENNGLTNGQIYQSLLNGSEDLIPGIDHQMDLELELYYSSRSTVGYTYPDTVRIWMNTKFFDVYTPAEVAHNVFHEWTHKLGYTHASSYTESRNSTVPYALGYLIEELGKKYE